MTDKELSAEEQIRIIEAYEERKKTPEGKKEHEALLKRMLETPTESYDSKRW